MIRLQRLLLKVRITNHEFESTINSLIEEGVREVNDQEEKYSKLQRRLKKLRKTSLTHDPELTVEVPTVQDDNNIICMELIVKTVMIIRVRRRKCDKRKEIEATLRDKMEKL